MKKHNNIWDLILEDFTTNPEDFGGPVSYQDIQKAEADLGLKFSRSYKDFLKSFGCAILPGHIIVGLKSINLMGDGIKTVVENTRYYWNQNWPGAENWYVVSDDGRGNPIGIDPEGKVWLSDHDAGFELVKLADSFEEFLYRLYRDTLYD